MPTHDPYTPAIAVEICERLAAGETLVAICNDEHMPSRPTVYKWVINDRDDFADRYARARDVGLDHMAENVIGISDDGRNDFMEREDPDNPGYALNGEHLQRSRLRVDTRKWYLSKLAPKRYGERLQVAETDTEGNDVAKRDPLDVLNAMFAEARRRRDECSDLV